MINGMNKLWILSSLLVAIAGIASCGGAQGEDPGRIYMPDMTYSRAYETYGYNNLGDYQKLKERGINYNGLPVGGTMARGDVSDYPFPGNDSGYALSPNFKNPYTTIQQTKAQRTEAERIYLINCGICHGTALDGNGPLWKGGDGPYPAAPRNLLDDYSKKLSDGTMYHVIEYGKGLMGSYAAQVKPEQRWWIINYIREKQGPATTAKDSTGGVTASGTATTDPTKTN